MEFETMVKVKVDLTESEKEILNRASEILENLCYECGVNASMKRIHVLGEGTYLIERLDWCGDILNKLSNVELIVAD